MTKTPSPDRYRRLDLLGRGGMGEVFLADDLVLRRKVAIKVVHLSTLANPRADKLLRREAKAAAALDNPFICKVYEVGEDDGRVFIAMEYVQGETLRQRMQGGPLPIRSVVSLAREIADGLEEAGRQGVVHRDLKPSNIIITPQGHIKIMDFGLAKRLLSEDAVEESSAATPDGMVVGTREYMSPEQLRGKPLEPSSDLFAFGLILFEMITGRHPFKKGSAIDTQFAILNDAAPEPVSADQEVPGELRDLVLRLLSKAASERPRIGEIRARLAGIYDSARPAEDKTLSSSASVEAFVARKPRMVLGLGLALLAALLALSLWIGLRPEPAMPKARMATLVTWPSNEEQAALSPDARHVTFISNRDGVKDIWLMDLEGGEPRRITAAPGNLTSQAFSEDGAEVVYTLETEDQKLLQTIRVDGGPPTRSVRLPDDMRIRRLVRWVGGEVFMETQRLDLVKVTLASQAVNVVATLPKETARPFNYDVSRDGQALTFGARNPDGSTSIWTQAPGAAARRVTESGFRDGSPFFTDGAGRQRLFFESDRSGQEDLWLMERPGQKPRQITFGSNREHIESASRDATTLIFSEVLEGASLFSFDLQSGSRHQLTAENKRDISPSVAAEGLLAFARVSLASDLPWSMSSVFLGNLDGGRVRDPRAVVRDGFSPALSPDGKWLAYLRSDPSSPMPRLNLLHLESAHSREVASLPPSARVFMAFPWYFGARDVQWSSRNELWFVQGSATEGSLIQRLDPRSGAPAEVVGRLEPGEVASSLLPSADGSRLFCVVSTDRKPGGEIRQIGEGRAHTRYTEASGSLAILGWAGPALIVTATPRLGQDRTVVHSLRGSVVRRLFELDARPTSLALIPGRNALAFSRRDSRDVENLFIRKLDTGAETAITTNGIQGVAFSPVTVLGTHTLVFSQQLRNRDLGIIRLDQP
jgi:Tol biopolymer transport system component/predicted Ser/Thr protein kinase